MKIATFNINNVNKRLGNLLEWLGEARPDVVCLQELKSTDADFPEAALSNAGYGAAWQGGLGMVWRFWRAAAIRSSRENFCLAIPAMRTAVISKRR